MNIKKDSERIIAGLSILAKNEDRPLDELKALFDGMNVSVMKNPDSLVGFAVSNALSLRDSLTLIAWVSSMLPFLNDIKTCDDVPYGIAAEYFEKARRHAIVLLRVNYILHEEMITVFDILERDGMMRFGIKKAAKETERVWDGMHLDRRNNMERPIWCTLQDHLRLYHDTMKPHIEGVYAAVRDYMISKGIRDVEIKARCEVVFLLGKVARHTFRAFFHDFERECGVDYTECFSDDDTSPLMKAFAGIPVTIGIAVAQDRHGCWESSFRPDDSQRVKWAWQRFMRVLRNDDVTDDSALKAISLNATVQEDYRKAVQEDEDVKMREKLEQLKGNFKVGKI